MSGLHALIYAAFALAGLLQLVAARWLAGKTRDLLRRGKRVPGRLVGADSHGTLGGRSSRHDLVEFTSEDGRRAEVSSRIGVPWSPYKRKPIVVIYDPEDLEHAVIDAWLELWAGPAILYTNGLLMALAALVVAVLDALGVITPNS